jgi:predicted nucleic acid-binding protein
VIVGQPPTFLDTSVLVRYLTDDPVHLAEAATAAIESGENLLLCSSKRATSK